MESAHVARVGGVSPRRCSNRGQQTLFSSPGARAGSFKQLFEGQSKALSRAVWAAGLLQAPVFGLRHALAPAAKGPGTSLTKPGAAAADPILVVQEQAQRTTPRALRYFFLPREQAAAE